jgi:hypothetical protein
MKAFVVKDGIIQNALNRPDRFPSLEHGVLKQVAGIVLHQTNSSTAEATLTAYRFRPSGTGAHFLIAPDGTIYQTARVDRICYHVGTLAPRCISEHSCSPHFLAAIKRIDISRAPEDDKRLLIHQLEMAKPLPVRFPSNNEAIGIEVTGAPENNVYPRPTQAQDVATVWLVAHLLDMFTLPRSAVFRHGEISRGKNKTEARHVRF